MHIRSLLALSGTLLALSAMGANAQNMQMGPTVCTQDYNPVCAVKNGSAQTYPNRCNAEAARARVIAQGTCKRRPVRVRG